MTRTFAPAAAAALSGSLLFAVAIDSSAQSLEPPPPLGPSTPVVAPPPAALPLTPVMPSAAQAAEESQDSGLGLEWVWLNADVGAGYVNMRSFSATTLGLENTEAGGPAFGVAGGVRLLFLTLGVRVRDIMLSSIGNLWEFSLEGKFHTRIGHVDPYFGVRGGYNLVGSLNSSAVQVAMGSTPSDVSVHGFNVGPMIGLDIYLAKLVSIGFDVDAQFLFIQRPPLPLPAGVPLSLIPPSEQQLYANSGSSVGLSVTPTAHLGIHF